MEATVTIPLEEFDRLRENDISFGKLFRGYDDFETWLTTQSSETENPRQRHEIMIQRYNGTNPKNPYRP